MSLLKLRNTPGINVFSPVQKRMSQRKRTTIPTTEALPKPDVTVGVYDNIKRKRKQGLGNHGKHAGYGVIADLTIQLILLNALETWKGYSCVD